MKVVITFDMPDDHPIEALGGITHMVEGAHEGAREAADYFYPGNCRWSVVGLPASEVHHLRGGYGIQVSEVW